MVAGVIHISDQFELNEEEDSSSSTDWKEQTKDTAEKCQKQDDNQEGSR